MPDYFTDGHEVPNDCYVNMDLIKFTSRRLDTFREKRSDLFERFLELLSNIDRENTYRVSEFNQLFYAVCDQTHYLTAPASTRYHLAKPYGLFEHSLNVAKTALKICEVLYPEQRLEESCVVCGLFHDLGKAFVHSNREFHPYPPYYKKNTSGKYPYCINTEGTFMTVPQKSLWFISQYMHLTTEEYQAILIHDGQYIPENKPYACKESPLSLIMHYADSWAGFVVEEALKIEKELR